ncbi:hypothetical protein MNB_SM-3-1163 [hydrothermal vent metagenome]|uniref:Uncharacterized protein n=1 Tax=hydrothermal vent metagenome TaxID=652676 RepID=A0A1W1D5N8_9ZZZZ
MKWMNFFKHKTQLHLRHAFGRDINADLSSEEEKLFNNSYEAFIKHQVLDGFDFFLRSLENFFEDKSNKNIIIQKKEENLLLFELYQGSAKVVGRVTKEDFYAEAILVNAKDANVSLKRYILERNYQLTYGCYFSDGEKIKLKIYQNNTIMTPQKIFFPLRELALNADYDKEHIKTEFPTIPLQDIAHIQPLQEEELQVKYEYFLKWIQEVEETALTLPSYEKNMMESFLYLHIFFGMDYLLVPKFKMYQEISKKLQEYFGDNEHSVEDKNEELKRYLEQLKKLSFQEFQENFYNAKYTFNQAENTGYESVVEFIDDSLGKVRWFKHNRYNQIVPIIYRYIAFYLLYNYGINPIAKALLHLLIEVQYPDFFQALGYEIYYDKEQESFEKKKIIAKIDAIITPHQSRFKSLEPFGERLSYTTLNEFCNSYYSELQNLSFEEVDV